jgi:Zn-dependent protease
MLNPESLTGTGVSGILIAWSSGSPSPSCRDSTPDALLALLAYQAFINSAILVFNLMPAFPLDGGGMLRVTLWRQEGSLERATMRAARVGRGFGYESIEIPCNSAGLRRSAGYTRPGYLPSS